jgi:hypothetical protein
MFLRLLPFLLTFAAGRLKKRQAAKRTASRRGATGRAGKSTPKRRSTYRRAR